MPANSVHTSPIGPGIWIGIENELRNKESESTIPLGWLCAKREACHNADMIVRDCGHLVKTDGSLDDYDREFVTHPFQMPKFKNVCEMFSKLGEHFYAPDHIIANAKHHIWYGLHVTVSGIPYDKVDLKNFVCNHKTKIEQIAGREENHYCEYVSSIHIRGAVNYRSNGSVEFRMFHATVKTHMLKVRVQMAIALMKYHKSLTWGLFVREVSGDPMLKDLNRFIQERRIL